VANPHHNLFHHGLIKLLVISELKKQGKTWEDFLYQFLNPHLTVKTSKKSIDPGTVTPPNPHSPKTPNPPIHPISLSDKKANKPIVDPPLSTNPIGSKQKKLQDSYFPPIPTRRRGANRFKGKSFCRSTRSMIGKTNTKPPTTSDPIPVVL
jgi:hypothetical protein